MAPGADGGGQAHLPNHELIKLAAFFLEETTESGFRPLRGLLRSLHRYQFPHCAELTIADATNNDQVLNPAKRSIRFAMFDDAGRQRFADARQGFQFVRPGGIDVDFRLSRLAYAGAVRT